MSEEDIEDRKNGEIHHYTFSLPPTLFNRISKHVHLSKALKNFLLTKRSWVLAAIKAKLERDDDVMDIPKDTRLSISVDKKTWNQINDRVEFIRKFRRTTYSNKQWLMEAIEEQLAIEEEEVKKCLEQEKLSKVP